MKEKPVFSQRIKTLRKEKALKQDELAETLGIGCQTLLNYELGRRIPAGNILASIELFFNVSGAYIFGLTDEPTFSGNQQSSLPDKETMSEEEMAELMARISTGRYKLVSTNETAQKEPALNAGMFIPYVTTEEVRELSEIARCVPDTSKPYTTTVWDDITNTLITMGIWVKKHFWQLAATFLALVIIMDKLT